MKKISITFALLLLSVSQVFAASFDCAKAKTTMEKTVCSDAKLSALDDELAKVYAETRKELRSRPNKLKKLIKDQRDWLKSLKTTKAEYLGGDYERRIKGLNHSLHLARATAPTAIGPSKDTVMRRLTEQLTQLKELVSKAKDVEISETLESNKPEVCNYIWKNIQEATVPEPTVNASTVEEKKQMYMQLREMAFYNQKHFVDMGNTPKDRNMYNSLFSYKWSKYERSFSEYGERMDATNLLFIQPDSRTGFKRPIFVTILLDLDEKGITVDRQDLAPDGLLQDDVSGLGNGGYSFEYYANYLTSEEPNVSGPENLLGLLSLNKEVMFWTVHKKSLTFKKNWKVVIQPVRNPVDGKDISCSFEFDSDS